MLRVPRPPKRTGALDLRGDGGVCGAHGRVHDVDAVFVGEGCVGALPGCDAAAAGAEEESAGLEPGCAEAVEEVCLAG